MFFRKNGVRLIAFFLMLAMTTGFSVAAIGDVEEGADKSLFEEGNIQYKPDNKKIEFYTYGDNVEKGTRVCSSRIAQQNVLILPSCVNAESVTLYCDSETQMVVEGALGAQKFVSGEPLNITELCGDDYKLSFYLDENRTLFAYELYLRFSENLSAVYLVSEDPDEKGREWVDSSDDKSNKAKGTMVMQKSDGNIVHSGALTQIKGRGNTTWGLVKKPYQIKLDKKADLLSTGDDSNQSKTWILLANYLDPLGVRNTMALNMGMALEMESNVQGESVDLYYDGEYRGTYMLTEKVEVGKGRVDIPDLESENEKANPDKNFEEFPVRVDVTENGALYTYCKNMKSPEDITGGYLLEMDYQERAVEEICFIRTKRQMYIVVKSPEYASKEEMNYIATLYQEYEDSVYNGGINPTTRKKYSDYIDEKSVAYYYLINELSKARDCFNSSAYISKKSGDEKFVMGPLWDYDMSFGKGSYDSYYGDDTSNGMSALYTEMAMALFKIDEFYETTKETYVNEVLPLVQNVLLGDKDAVSDNGALRSIEYYRDNVTSSANNNSALWYMEKDLNPEFDKLITFVYERCRHLDVFFKTFPRFGDIPENTFYDVLPYEWYFDDVTTTGRESILNGVGNGFFKPEYNVRRSQMVQAVFNMSGVKDIEFTPLYTDVTMDSWFADAVLWAAESGFLEGYPKDVFGHNERVTREEFITLLYRFSGCPTADIHVINKYSDFDMITQKDALAWAVDAGILQGSANCINPTGYMTRAEFATILVRYWNIRETVALPNKKASF